MYKRIKIFICLCGVFYFIGGLPSLYATTVRPLGLEEMVALADRIFVGEVTEVKEGKDEHGTFVTYVTFSASHASKGEVPPKLTIKQLGRRTPDESGRIFRIPGLPTYHVGEEVVLFLHGTSQRGFTSPVGLGQGKFKVIRKGSNAFAENELGGARLHSWKRYGLKTVQGSAGTMELSGFLSVVERMIKSQHK